MFSEVSVRYLSKLTRPLKCSKERSLMDTNSVIQHRHFTSSQIVHVQIPRIQVDVSKSVSKVFNDENFKPKHHPGTLFRGKVCLPTQFIEGAETIIKRSPQPSLEDIDKFNNYLISRRLPIERRDYRILIDKIESDIRTRDKIMEPFLSKEETISLENKRFQETKKTLKSLIYHWEPINFDTSKSLTYLMTRAAGEYAALYKIFYEIAMHDPDFKPTSLLDFGSGLATVTWAANAFWNNSLKEHVCVDSSRDINDMAELILKRGNQQRGLMFPGVFFRQFLPESQKTHYELVTSAYSLLELPGAKERISTLNTLWRKCSKYIVIIERGTDAGFQILNEARDFILRLDRKTQQPANCYVTSPCPHDAHCPQYNSSWEGTCHFNVLYRHLSPFDKEKLGREKFCYVVIKRGERDMTTEKWPRLIRAPLKRNRHCICRVCMPEGKITEIVLTKSKNSKSLYRAARKSKLGDFLPVTEILTETSSISQTDEKAIGISDSDSEDDIDLENDFEVDENPSGDLGKP